MMTSIRRAPWAFWATMLSGCAFSWTPAFDETVDATKADTIAIAAVDEALTFARFDGAGGRRLVLVTEYAEGIVHGVDVGTAIGAAVADPIAAFRTHGYETLRQLAAAPPSSRVSMPARDLVIPLELADSHIAAGTNFPEHAADAGVEDGPFLFAKMVLPTGPDADVPAGRGLLDYEVELAWVTLEPLRQGSLPAYMGVMLCNDYTDRETLLRHADPYDVASGKGFTTGKSFPGFLPVGNLFVIPRDFRAFAAGILLELAVNDRLRQRSPASAMVWDFDEILNQTWARRGRTWEHRGAQIALPGASGVIPERTLILAGTPHGTVFDGIRRGQIAAGASAWLLGGWSEPVASHVIDAYVADAGRAGIYLKPGDRVTIRADNLGVIRNRIAG